MYILTSTQKYVDFFGIHIVGLRPCPAMAMGCNFMLFPLLGMHNSDHSEWLSSWGFAAMALEFKPGQDALRSNSSGRLGTVLDKQFNILNSLFFLLWDNSGTEISRPGPILGTKPEAFHTSCSYLQQCLAWGKNGWLHARGLMEFARNFMSQHVKVAFLCVYICM